MCYVYGLMYVLDLMAIMCAKATCCRLCSGWHLWNWVDLNLSYYCIRTLCLWAVIINCRILVWFGIFAKTPIHCAFTSVCLIDSHLLMRFWRIFKLPVSLPHVIKFYFINTLICIFPSALNEKLLRGVVVVGGLDVGGHAV